MNKSIYIIYDQSSNDSFKIAHEIGLKLENLGLLFICIPIDTLHKIDLSNCIATVLCISNNFDYSIEDMYLELLLHHNTREGNSLFNYYKGVESDEEALNLYLAEFFECDNDLINIKSIKNSKADVVEKLHKLLHA